jgi:hypothetical protein
MQKPLDFKHENKVSIPYLCLYKKMALEKLLLGTTIMGSLAPLAYSTEAKRS